MRNKNTQENPNRHFISFWSEAGRLHFFLRIEDTLIIPKRHYLDHTNKKKTVVRYKNKCFSILDSTIEIILTLCFKGCLISYAHTVNFSMSFTLYVLQGNQQFDNRKSERTALLDTSQVVNEFMIRTFTYVIIYIVLRDGVSYIMNCLN